MYTTLENNNSATGILRFAKILLENAWDLVTVNLLGCLCMLPAAVSFLAVLLAVQNFWLAFFAGMLFGIPIGGAISAIEKVSLEIVREREGKAVTTFWETFRGEWKQSIPLGWMAYFEIMVIVFAILFHKEINAFEMPVRLWALFVIVLLFLHIVLTYSFSQQVLIELSLWKLLKNSVILFFSNFGKSMLCLFITLAILGVLFILVPFSLLFILLLGFSLVSLIRQLFVWPIMNRLFSIDERQAAGRKKI